MYKRQLLLLLFIFCVNFSKAQQSLSRQDSILFSKIINEFVWLDTIKTTIIVDVKNNDTTYRSRYISSPTFDSLYKPIHGKVMLGNSDLVNQGSAYALTVNQFESKFSINYNWAKN